MNIHTAIKNIKWRLSSILFQKERHAWHNVLLECDDFRKGYSIPINEYSKKAPIKYIKKKRAICIFDGKIKNGGLADRLRGIISVYEICKTLEMDFKILFYHPFHLHDFLVPNKFDWKINAEDLNYNSKITDICYIETIAGTDYEARKQKEWFTREFKKKYKEFHVRSNAFFSYSGNYSALFHELFKPNEKLQEKIDFHTKILGKHYISTSFRFLDLLNDFNEPFGKKKVLSTDEKQELIDSNIKQIEKLHAEFPNRKILVNSDSTTFLNIASKLEYTYIIPGNITHIDGNNSQSNYDIYEKTFLDFFMIANSEKIYLLKTGMMHDSGYPYAASLINDRPFKRIEF